MVGWLLGKIESVLLERLTSAAEAFLSGICIDANRPTVVVLWLAARVEGPRAYALSSSVYSKESAHVALQKPLQHGSRIHPSRLLGPGWTSGRRGWYRSRPRPLPPGTGPQAALGVSHIDTTPLTGLHLTTRHWIA